MKIKTVLKKVFNPLILVAILSSFLIGSLILASPYYEDLDTYTEVDSGTKIEVDGVRADFVNFTTDCESWLYYDFGEDYFNGNFIVEFEVYVDSQYAGTTCQMFIAGVTNVLGDGMDMTTSNSAVSVHLRYGSVGHPTLNIYENSGGAGGGNPQTVDIDTLYYCTIKRASNYIYLYIYDDVDRQNQVGYTYDNLAAISPYRYIMPIIAMGVAPNTYAQTGYVKNFVISEGAGVPVIETIEAVDVTWSESANKYQCLLSANLTSDGGGCGVFFLVSDDDGVTWFDTGANDIDDDEIYTGYLFLSLTEEGKEYLFKARAFNAHGEDTGTEYSFTVEITNKTAPSVVTLDWPMTVGENTTVWGSIYNDGGDNCTGWFYYKTLAAENWTSTQSANTTDLKTLNGFSGILTGIPEDLWIMFKATAQNDYGSANGSVVYFMWEDSVMPTCSTLWPIDVGDSEATLTGNITDAGGGFCVVGFDYREFGDTEFNRVELGGSYSTGFEYSYTLYGLSPLTTYEYRALASNEAGYNEIDDYYVYAEGNIVAFSTDSALSIPVLVLNSVVYHDNYTVVCDIDLTNDGGHSCRVNMEYRIKHGDWFFSTTPSAVGVNSGESVLTYITGLNYGTLYEFRAWAFNAFDGGTGYSNVVEFQLIAEDDTTTPTGDDVTDVSGDISNWLGQYGLNNVAGKLLVIAVACLLVFLICVGIGVAYHCVNITVIVATFIDTIIIIFGMVIGYIPPLLMGIVLVVFSALVAVKVVGLFRGKSEVE